MYTEKYAKVWKILSKKSCNEDMVSREESKLATENWLYEKQLLFGYSNNPDPCDKWRAASEQTSAKEAKTNLDWKEGLIKIYDQLTTRQAHEIKTKISPKTAEYYMTPTK